MKTFLQCCDEVTKTHNSTSKYDKMSRQDYELLFYKEAAELYAQSAKQEGKAEGWSEGRKATVTLTSNAVNPYKS